MMQNLFLHRIQRLIQKKNVAFCDFSDSTFACKGALPPGTDTYSQIQIPFYIFRVAFRGRLPLRIFAGILLILIFATSGFFFEAAMADENSYSEAEIKAAFLLKFPYFVDWPAAAVASKPTTATFPLRLGIVGEDPFGRRLPNGIVPVEPGQTAFLVARLPVQSGNLADFQILYFSDSQSKATVNALLSIRHAPVLTVGEGEAFLKAMKTILVVDDFPENVDLLGRALSPEYKVVIAMKGADALRIAASLDPPDLILLDVLMPEMDGFEVCERLKGHPETKGIPVIFITGLADEVHESRGLALGAVDFLTKPLNPDLVRLRVRNHMNLQDLRQELKHCLELLKNRK